MEATTMTTEQLKAELLKREKEEKQAKQRRKEEYEKERNAMVADMVEEASELENILQQFKNRCLRRIEEFRERANQYGDIRSNSKGGFRLRNSDTQEVVSLDRNSVPDYDERANMAEDLIKDFLQDAVKKKDQQTYRTISALMERNKKGDFTPSRIASLMKVRDNYSDERWVKAMQLFEESFLVRDISYSVSFYRKDEMGKDTSICLSFASLPVEEQAEAPANSSEETTNQ